MENKIPEITNNKLEIKSKEEFKQLSIIVN